MYFMVAYELWPQLTRLRAAAARASIKAQLWLWFVGMMVLSMPWHLVGLLGMPRRMAYYDYTPSRRSQPQAWTVTLSAIGGLLLVVSGAALRRTSWRGRTRKRAAEPAPFTLQRRRASRPRDAARAQRLRALGGDDDRPDGRELRLSDRCSSPRFKETSVPAVSVGAQ